jgi:hypothetical protein
MSIPYYPDTLPPNTKMPKEIKDLWVAALRSGEDVTRDGVTSWEPTYEQGKGKLEHVTYKNDTLIKQYCCLGVLQMVCDGRVEYKAGGMESALLPSGEWNESHNISFHNSPFRCGASFLVDGRIYDATELNDNMNYSFAQIADIIEEQVEGF